MTGAHYRLVFRGDQPEESGDADVRVADGVLVLSPPGGEVLRVPMREIASVAADGFCVRVTVASGVAIELSRLGVMRTALLADLRDAQVREAAVACGAIGTGETFRAGAEDVRVYEDALLLAGPEGSERVGFSFVTAVSEHDYAVTIEVAGRDAIVLTRLGRRTSELAGLLRARVTQSRNRTAAFVGALLSAQDQERGLHAAGPACSARPHHGRPGGRTARGADPPPCPPMDRFEVGSWRPPGPRGLQPVGGCGPGRHLGPVRTGPLLSSGETWQAA